MAKPDRLTEQVLQEIRHRLRTLEEETFVMNPPNEHVQYLSCVRQEYPTKPGEAHKWRFISEPVEFAEYHQQGLIAFPVVDEAVKSLPLCPNELFYPPWLEEFLRHNPLVLATTLYVSTLTTTKSIGEKYQRPIATAIANSLHAFRDFMDVELINHYNHLLGCNYLPEKLQESYLWKLTDQQWEITKSAILDAKLLIAEWVYCSFNNDPMDWAAMLMKYEQQIEECNRLNLIPRIQAGYAGLFRNKSQEKSLISSVIPVHTPEQTAQVQQELAAEAQANYEAAKPAASKTQVIPTPVKPETYNDFLVIKPLNIPFKKKNS